jgi:signal transduction histidine kinase
MSVVVAQAQGAEAVMVSDPDRARVALHTISGTTRDALVELRRLLGIIRPGGTDGAGLPKPQPGLSDIAALESTGRAAGLEVHVEIDGPAAGVLPGVALSAYRVAQEALTNAAKHAPGARADVRVVVGSGQVTISVVNGPGLRPSAELPGSRSGLAGMRERVDLFGGTLDAGPTPEGGWSVVARFPTLEAPPTSE